MNEYVTEAWVVERPNGHWMGFTNAAAAWSAYDYWLDTSMPFGMPMPACTHEEELGPDLEFDSRNPNVTNQFVKAFRWKGETRLVTNHYRG